MKSVFVFRTSVSTPAAVTKIKPLLDGLIQHGERWNFDLEDWENILRVESAACQADQVIEVLKVAGYECEELQD